MLKRKIEKDILRWIEKGDNALLVSGVHQAGKTYVIRKCLEKTGSDFIEFNLIDMPQVSTIINSASDTSDLIMKLSLLSGREVTPGKTIFFFDEIQRCKEIVTRIKFLVDDRRYRYILSGSLLGAELVSLRSAPVGYLETLNMYPLDFEEFLQVFAVKEELIGSLRRSYLDKTPVDDEIHKKMIEIFNLYLIIGGMPAAVELYRQSGNIDDVIRNHSSLVERYKEDFTQYEAENRKLLISQIYNLIPSELNEKNKRFNVRDIKKNLRYDRIEDSFIWLLKAGVALGVFNVTAPAIPLMLNEKNSLFKLFLSDVGLLTSIYGRSSKLAVLMNYDGVNKGAIYENVVAQELNSHGYPLYYYNSKKNGELDFVIEHNGKVLPLEVKSGKDYERHSALDNVLSIEEYGIEEAYVLSNANVKRKGKITYLPIYMIMFLDEKILDFPDISAASHSF